MSALEQDKQLDSNNSFLFENKEKPRVSYCVLARKYRPSTFSGLIGQETLVRTLTNAITSNRIAHAYILTGIRGIGKTSTARIIARSLNCIGIDGKGTSPTIEPCGVCCHCKAIEEDKHLDVFEIDAASRTGIDDIREILQNVRYKPSTGRYKIYIIDEVHMLSKNAFNALLKTLEEPPAHVKFIFATTEIRKVLPTILSRCQRFDLKRVSTETLEKHFANIASLEKIEIEKEAIAIIAKAAEGSVRDGLSLLDGVISHSQGKITANEIRKTIGLADRTILFDIFYALMNGETLKALELFSTQNDLGAEPLNVLQDLLELTHFITKAKIAPNFTNNPTIPEEERTKGQQLAEKLPVSILTRTFQMLLKGIDETKESNSPLMTAEMCLIRIAFVSDLPTPEKALLELKKKSSLTYHVKEQNDNNAVSAIKPEIPLSITPVIEIKPEEKNSPIKTFWDIQAILMKNKEMLLAHSFANDTIPVSIANNIITIAQKNKLAHDFANKLSEKISAFVGTPYKFVITDEQGGKSLAEQTSAIEAQKRKDIAEIPLIKKILETFPNAEIESITNHENSDDTLEKDLVIEPIIEEDK